MIQFSHVTKVYPGGFTAIQDITFSVEKGDFLFLCGASGAGKSTVLKHLYMDDRPSAGRVFVCGYDSHTILPRDVPFLRRKLGVVFQDFKLLDDRTIFENIAFPLRVTEARERALKHRVFEVLAWTGLSHKSFYYPSQLSGGEQQRVAIARAIANDPWVLLADEPTGNLDLEVSKEIFSLLQAINSRGTTVIMATHDQQLIEPFHYRRIMLSQGVLVKETH
ncbi:MAG: cell division ATP-binding protein FtsE [Chitinispirillaceae bacterium]|nr:cell division ATP-binding protein FtsE [Chitinispirillaceae bacterium]